ncbi:unnamed protein product [Dracunculus medinensis]|uniref:t-SNARE coiled-coil homology domain-containing protein n=1 Tax=Dracunculus medinensis TaxID=318479 RepID=A0A0N4UAA9_DRAME|nr:unnamed protein product [Dracunculus medinensis]
MSVDKTIEELSYTLAQLGSLVGHINAQIIGITSRINMTLDTFDNSVANIAADASVVTQQVALTISQIPNAWIFYLLFISLTVVFILLSVILLIKLVIRCHGIYQLVFRSNRSNPEFHNFSNLPPSPSYVQSRSGHISIPMEHEPRKIGVVANGDISNCNAFLLHL